MDMAARSGRTIQIDGWQWKVLLPRSDVGDILFELRNWHDIVPQQVRG